MLMAGLGGSGLGRDSGAEQTSHTMLSVARFRSGSWEATGSKKHMIVRGCARVPIYGWVWRARRCLSWAGVTGRHEATRCLVIGVRFGLGAMYRSELGSPGWGVI